MKKKTTTPTTREEATKKIAELNEKLRTIRFGIAGSRTKNVKEQGNFKKEIARLQTVKKSLEA